MRHRPRLISLIAALLALAIGVLPVLAQEADSFATPGAGAPTSETLLDTTIDAMPAGHAFVSVDHWRLQPGPQALTVPALGGPVTIAVESGALSATEGGHETPLAVGEPQTFSGREAIAFQVVGPAAVTAVVVYVVPEASELSWVTDPQRHTMQAPIGVNVDDLPGGTGHLLLERITLPPGSTVPSQAVPRWVWWGIGQGRVGVTLDGERLPARWEAGEERQVAAGQALPLLAPGTRMQLRNGEEQPAVLYRLTLTPERTTASETTPLLAMRHDRSWSRDRHWPNLRNGELRRLSTETRDRTRNGFPCRGGAATRHDDSVL